MADSSTDLLKSRISILSPPTHTGKCVLYVMSRDQRISYNHALLAAQKHALAKSLPLAVVFILKPKSGYRSREQYQWMLKGLKEVETELFSKNIPFLLFIGEPKERIEGMLRHLEPDAIYFDMSPLRGGKKLQQYTADIAKGAVYVVDTHNVVPVWKTSNKQEFSARTIRPKIHSALAEFTYKPESIKQHPYAWTGRVMNHEELQGRIDKVIADLPSNGQTDLEKRFPSGSSQARKHLRSFIQSKLVNYHEQRNDPTKDGLSGLSPYLHFGQLSSLEVLIEVLDALGRDRNLQTGVDTLIEEMIVRKELSDNFCYYNYAYDKLAGAPDWAKKTLEKHSNDQREHIYTREEFEHAKTHDRAWNATQLELLKNGKMHGYMRMYWAKKVLEWSKTPEEAIETLLYLNDFYSIDGGDPNGYVGILWSVAGLHDRPWGERPVYGTVRSMVYGGLKRKFKIDDYIEKWTNNR